MIEFLNGFRPWWITSTSQQRQRKRLHNHLAIISEIIEKRINIRYVELYNNDWKRSVMPASEDDSLILLMFFPLHLRMGFVPMYMYIYVLVRLIQPLRLIVFFSLSCVPSRHGMTERRRNGAPLHILSFDWVERKRIIELIGDLYCMRRGFCPWSALRWPNPYPS